MKHHRAWAPGVPLLVWILRFTFAVVLLHTREMADFTLATVQDFSVPQILRAPATFTQLLGLGLGACSCSSSLEVDCARVDPELPLLQLAYVGRFLREVCLPPCSRFPPRFTTSVQAGPSFCGRACLASNDFASARSVFRAVTSAWSC